MTSGAVSFALNHMCAPHLPVSGFFDLALSLGITAAEIRNDLTGNAMLDGTPAEVIRSEAERRKIRLVSINALQRFNDWTDDRAKEARALLAYAAASGAQALVLVPSNDGTGCANGERQGRLRIALKQLRPMLEDKGITGLVEPLGFETCSLRSKSEAAEAIRSLDAVQTFKLVHDTFHHHLAGEAAIFPQLTGLVHISGVSDPAIGVAEMRDAHRVLVDERDRLDNIGQIRSLLAQGYSGALSFEPFAEAIHALKDARPALKASMDLIVKRTTRRAA